MNDAGDSETTDEPDAARDSDREPEHPMNRPFFFGLAPVDRQRRNFLDVHTSQTRDGGRQPAVLFVHGGPVPEGQLPRPRDWEGFNGYAALAAASGLVGITFNHRLHTEEHYPLAAEGVAAAVEQTRELDSVDSARIGLWFFCVGGGLAADWLASPPDWLGCVAWTYPVLVPPPDWSGDRERFDAVTAASSAPRLPKLLLRVGDEYEYFAQTQNDLVDSVREHGGDLEVIELPETEHGFEHLGYDAQSRDGVDRAMQWVSRILRR
ncbi:MAG TPA: dienelactone hydrolase family protein [Candidatus Brevibacterium intestinavium]|nr:dienelactone hydrolase family protein [Candidatus Brevibacterium intestinavium]